MYAAVASSSRSRRPAARRGRRRTATRGRRSKRALRRPPDLVRALASTAPCPQRDIVAHFRDSGYAAPAARARDSSCSARLRLASSIISPPSIAAPRPVALERLEDRARVLDLARGRGEELVQGLDLGGVKRPLPVVAELARARRRTPAAPRRRRPGGRGRRSPARPRRGPRPAPCRARSPIAAPPPGRESRARRSCRRARGSAPRAAGTPRRSDPPREAPRAVSISAWMPIGRARPAAASAFVQHPLDPGELLGPLDLRDDDAVEPLPRGGQRGEVRPRTTGSRRR